MTNHTDDPLLIVKTFLTRTLGYPINDFNVQCIDNALKHRNDVFDELRACRAFLLACETISADAVRERCMRIDDVLSIT